MPTPTQRDPSRTSMLRRSMVADVNRRFSKLQRNVRTLVQEENAFGLGDITQNRRFAFLTNRRKVAAFRAWLQEQVDEGILESSSEEPWTDEYVGSAYRKGVIRSATDAKRAGYELAEETAFSEQIGFLQSAFRTTESVARLEMLYTRTFEGLTGITQQMSTNMSRTLALGLADGLGADEVARNLNREVKNIGINRARTLARTEIVYAQAEGQLDGFEELEIEELEILAEWSTTGDDLVCPLCRPLEGTVYTVKEARGLLPRHPNCRCAWIPGNVGEELTNVDRKEAIRQSVVAERPGRTVKEALRESRWSGADRENTAGPKKDFFVE